MDVLAEAKKQRLDSEFGAVPFAALTVMHQAMARRSSPAERQAEVQGRNS